MPEAVATDPNDGRLGRGPGDGSVRVGEIPVEAAVATGSIAAGVAMAIGYLTARRSRREG
jgi:hypothetical protein